MKISENALFAAAIVLVAAAVLGYLAYGHYSPPIAEQYAPLPPTTSTETTSTTVTSATETTTTVQEAPPQEAPPAATYSTTTSSSTTTTTATTTTLRARPTYLDRFSGRGLRQATMHIKYFCPTCVEAVAATIQKAPGIMGRSMGWGQKVSWIVYDPKIIGLDRVIELASSSGGVDFYNDTAIG